MKKYSIAYSITAHESPECVMNLYENIVKFHPGIPVLVVFHTNPALYRECMRLPQHDNLWFHPVPKKKERFTASIFLAHLENYKFIERQDFDFFCTLASNCMFVRPVDMDSIRATTPGLYIGGSGYKMFDPEKWTYQEFLKNVHLVNTFKQNDISVEVVTHEGAYFRKEVMGEMVDFCRRKKIDSDAFVYDTLAAEEVILPSLEKYLTGMVSLRYGIWIPGVKLKDVVSLAETGTCPSAVRGGYNIVKVPRDMENECRKYINSI